MASSPWWQDPVTQKYNPPVEPGEDIGTPFHTPITALLPGSVAGISYGGYGARVDVATAQGDVYYQHLDTVATGIRKGASVTAGEDIGLSGGQLWGGSLPNSPLNSTGPHVEVGVVYAGRSQDPSTLIGMGPQLALNPFTAPAGVGGGPGSGGGFSGQSNVTAQQSQNNSGPASGSGSLINVTGPTINVPNPFSGLSTWIGNLAGTGGSWLSGNIIPLAVAAVIILIVLGTGQQQSKPAPQIVPVPV